jgi:hypothetical protein
MKLGAWVVAALVVSSCGGAQQQAVVPTTSAPTPSPTASPSPPPATPSAVASRTLDNGWTRLDVTSEGFTIDVPPKWRALVLDAETLDASIKSMTAQNPDLATVLNGDALRQALASGMKLIAFDVDPTHNVSGFGNNLNILKQPLSVAVSLDFYTQANVAQIEELLKVKTSVRRLTLANGSLADEVSYDRILQQAQGPLPTSFRQYFVVSGQTAWILTFTVAQTKLAAYGDLLQQSAKSFNPR